jgi:hypothetical protein
MTKPSSKRMILYRVTLTFALFLLTMRMFSYSPMITTEGMTRRISNSSIVVRDMYSPTLMPYNPRIYLIHVGKAGGTTLNRALGLSGTLNSVKCMVNNSLVGEDSSSCYSHSSRTSQLERRTLGYYHMWGFGLDDEERKWLHSNTNVFLFTVREPIDRIISAYNFHRQLFRQGNADNDYPKFYKECFPNGIDAAVDTLRRVNRTVCMKLGVEVFSGQKFHGGGRHFRFNYGYYKRKTIDESPNHAVAVIRTERLWDDVIHLDRLLGGTGDFGRRNGLKHSHGSENYTAPHSVDLSVPNTIFLCCLIYKDMEAYQQLILKAANLDGAQKSETLNHLLHRCQVKAPEHDLVNHPFQWQAFRQGRTCTGFM